MTKVVFKEMSLNEDNSSFYELKDGEVMKNLKLIYENNNSIVKKIKNG